VPEQEPKWQGPDVARIEKERARRAASSDTERKPPKVALFIVSLVVGFLLVFVLWFSLAISGLCDSGDCDQHDQTLGLPGFLMAALACAGVAAWQSRRGYGAAATGWLVLAIVALGAWAVMI
jgi:hypothetical protein